MLSPDYARSIISPFRLVRKVSQTVSGKEVIRTRYLLLHWHGEGLTLVGHMEDQKLEERGPAGIFIVMPLLGRHMTTLTRLKSYWRLAINFQVIDPSRI
jgi:hypothetical protein